MPTDIAQNRLLQGYLDNISEELDGGGNVNVNAT